MFEKRAMGNSLSSVYRQSETGGKETDARRKLPVLPRSRLVAGSWPWNRAEFVGSAVQGIFVGQPT